MKISLAAADDEAAEGGVAWRGGGALQHGCAAEPSGITL